MYSLYHTLYYGRILGNSKIFSRKINFNYKEIFQSSTYFWYGNCEDEYLHISRNLNIFSKKVYGKLYGLLKKCTWLILRKSQKYFAHNNFVAIF